MNNIKNKIKMNIANDKFEVPIQAFKNLKNEVTDCVKHFVKLPQNEISMNVKVLKEGRYLINFQILTDNLIFNNSDID